jgi:hypothetical protein
MARTRHACTIDRDIGIFRLRHEQWIFSILYMIFAAIKSNKKDARQRELSCRIAGRCINEGRPRGSPRGGQSVGGRPDQFFFVAAGAACGFAFR